MPTEGVVPSTGWLLLFATTHDKTPERARLDMRLAASFGIDHKFAHLSASRGCDAVARPCSWRCVPTFTLLIGDEPIVDVLMARKRKPRKKPVPKGKALALAKTKLADAIADMSHKRLKSVVGDDNKVRSVWIASRYDELAEAIEAARGGSGGRWNNQLPFWADAFVLLADVDAEIAKMHKHPEGWKGWTPHRLQALEQQKWRPQDCDVMKQYTETLDMLVKRIDQLFAPRPIGLPDPCPECGNKIVYRDSDGEKVRTHALQITENGCTCGNCKANWPIEHLELLGKILESQRAAAKAASVSVDDDSDAACG